MDQLLTFAIQAAFFAVFGVTLIRYLRERTRLNRDVLLVFAAMAGLFATQLLTVLWPARPQAVASAASILLLAEPYLVLRLVRHFQRVDRRIEIGVLVAFVISSAVLLTNAGAANRVVTLFVVAYFVGASFLGSWYLVRAASQRAGSGHSRLRIAAVANALLGFAVLIAGAGSAASPGAAPSVVTVVSRVVALLAALAFLAAFAPPQFLRRYQQRAVAFDLARGLVTAPTGTPPDVSWGQLAAAAGRITGARATAIVLGRPRPVLRVADGVWRTQPTLGSALDGLDDDATPVARIVRPDAAPLRELAAAADATLVIQIPIGSDRQPVGWLLAFLSGSPLFVEDDLALLTLLASLTARAIEREDAVAERTTLVSELRRTNDELARASTAKSDFLAAMSHELRTPLNSIIGFSELMLAPVNRSEGLRPLDVADWAAHIHGAGLQLLDLINEVLDLAKIEAGRLELKHERFDLALLLQRTADAMRPVGERRGVSIELTTIDSLPIEADPARVRQIVYNLLSNAIKFSPEGAQVRVQTEAVDGEVRVSVEDRGPGIAREDQLRLFEAFQQTARGRAQAEGTGLGLALARQLAERHGGRIELISDVGAGSRFTLVLPIVAPAAELPRTVPGLSRPVVLVVEDDAGSAELLRAYLEPDGYDVAIARDGEAGLDHMRRLHPAAVILDIMLPGIDGWEVMQRARSEPSTRDIPILVVSLIDDSELGLALGAVDFFAKPVDRSVLLRRLRRLIATSGEETEQPVVLAIDDEPAVIEMYRAMLEPNGFRVLAAASGRDGVRLARRHCPDVVLLDLTMPDMDGFEVAAALHRDEATADVPILVVTSRELSPEDKERLNGHVTEILQKGDDAAAGLRRWLAAHLRQPDLELGMDGHGDGSGGHGSDARDLGVAAGAPRLESNPTTAAANPSASASARVAPTW